MPDLRDPVTRRCHKCKSILLKHEPGAIADGLRVEVKCKCNALNYLEGTKAERTPTPTQGRTKAGPAQWGNSDRSTDYEGTQREASAAHQ